MVFSLGRFVAVRPWRFLLVNRHLAAAEKSLVRLRQKAGFNYQPVAFNEPPVMRGFVNGRPITFFNDLRETADARGKRFFTAIELDLGAGMPTGAALATPSFASFLSTLNMPQTLKPEIEGWSPAYVVKTRDAAALTSYLTPARLKVLQALFAMKTVETLLFFDEEASVLRFELSDPLRSVDRLEKLVLRIGQAGNVLAPDQQAPAPPS